VFSEEITASKSTLYKYVIKGLEKGTVYGVQIQALSAYRESVNSTMKLAVPNINGEYLICIGHYMFLRQQVISCPSVSEENTKS